MECSRKEPCYLVLIRHCVNLFEVIWSLLMRNWFSLPCLSLALHCLLSYYSLVMLTLNFLWLIQMEEAPHWTLLIWRCVSYLPSNSCESSAEAGNSSSRWGAEAGQARPCHQGISHWPWQGAAQAQEKLWLQVRACPSWGTAGWVWAWEAGLTFLLGHRTTAAWNWYLFVWIQSKSWPSPQNLL